MTYRAPKGTADILPPDSRAWRRVLLAWEELCERYGYDLALTPIFESTEVFARGVGGDTDIVQKQMYTFSDKGGRSLTLRPEATASIVRAYVQAGTQGVMKVATSGPFFRYEQPQAGRRRQFYQLDAEYLGEPSADADVEIIELGYRLLQAAGISDPIVLLNSIGDAEDRRSYRQALVAFLNERRESLSEESQERIGTNPLRVLDSKEDADVLADAPATFDYLSADTKAHFASVRDGLERLGIPYQLEARLVRGLDYYNRTVFEYVPPGYEAAQSAVGGGGRYDGLAETLGGDRVPAVGVAMGLDRIMLAAGETDSGAALDAFVVLAEPERRDDALELLSVLRNARLRADMDLGSRSVKAQFRAADRRRARTAVVIGEELGAGSLTVRDLTSGEQFTVARDEIVEWLSE
ncbi:MAG: histidine--tRNA ligase [Acidimicrobiia bacterium]